MNSHQRRVAERADFRQWRKNGGTGDRFYWMCDVIIIRRPGIVRTISMDIISAKHVVDQLSKGVLFDECDRLSDEIIFRDTGWKKYRR